MKKNIFFIFVICLLSLTGCRKDLCYDHESHATKVRVHMTCDWLLKWERTVTTDWKSSWNNILGFSYESLVPAAGSSTTAYVYTNGKIENKNMFNHAEGSLPMNNLPHDILVHNDDVSYIHIDKTDEDDFVAYTGTRSRSGFTRAGSRTCNIPEPLFVGNVKNFQPEETHSSTDFQELVVTMKPVVYTYVIYYKFKTGVEYVTKARGSLSGMAEGVFLKDMCTSGSTATFLFDNCNVDDKGVYTTIRTFGVPSRDLNEKGPCKKGSFELGLEIEGLNGKVMEYTFDVTDQVRSQPYGGVIVVDNIVVDSKDANEDGMGFQPDIEDWVDENIDIL